MDVEGYAENFFDKKCAKMTCLTTTNGLCTLGIIKSHPYYGKYEVACKKSLVNMKGLDRKASVIFKLAFMWEMQYHITQYQ